VQIFINLENRLFSINKKEGKKWQNVHIVDVKFLMGVLLKFVIIAEQEFGDQRCLEQLRAIWKKQDLEEI
jgi:hypothetical protein